MQKINPEKSFEPTAGYIFLNCRFIGKNCLPEVASCFVISIRIYNFFIAKYMFFFIFLHCEFISHLGFRILHVHPKGIIHYI